MLFPNRIHSLIERVEEEYEGYHCMRSPLTASLHEKCRTCGLKCEENEHPNARCQEKEPTSKPVNQKCRCHRNNQIPDLQNAIDQELSGGAGDTNGI